MRIVKRTALVCAACVMAAASAAAQNCHSRRESGLRAEQHPQCRSSHRSDHGVESVDVSTKVGLVGGGFVQFAFNDRSHSSLRCCSCMKGVNLNLTDNARTTATAQVNYLEFPIFLRFNRTLNDTLRGFVMAGPSFAVKVGTGGTLDGVSGTSDFDIDPAIGSQRLRPRLRRRPRVAEVPDRSALRPRPDRHRHRHLLPRRRTDESLVQHHGRIAPAVAPNRARNAGTSALQLRPVSMGDLGLPGEFPFTRGIQPTMYRGRLWTMRQYAGLRHGRRVERALPLSAGPGRQRA